MRGGDKEGGRIVKLMGISVDIKGLGKLKTLNRIWSLFP